MKSVVGFVENTFTSISSWILYGTTGDEVMSDNQDISCGKKRIDMENYIDNLYLDDKQISSNDVANDNNKKERNINIVKEDNLFEKDIHAVSKIHSPINTAYDFHADHQISTTTLMNIYQNADNISASYDVSKFIHEVSDISPDDAIINNFITDDDNVGIQTIFSDSYYY